MRGRPRLLPLVAAALVAAIDVFYLILVDSDRDGRVRFVAASLAAAALLAVVGAVRKRGAVAVAMLSVSASILLIWAFLGMFSIGILIAVPAVLTLAALAHAINDDTLVEPVLAALAMAAAVSVTLYGLSAT